MKVNGQWVLCERNSSYSLIPILLKLYICCDYALKICILFGYNPQIFFFLSFFHNLVIFFGHFSEWILGTLCAQLLVQFKTDIFKTPLTV